MGTVGVLGSGKAAPPSRPLTPRSPSKAPPVGPATHSRPSSCRFFFLSGFWQLVPFTLGPAQGRRRCLKVPLLPQPPGCSWGAMGSAAAPRRRRRLVFILSDPELRSRPRPALSPFPRTARSCDTGSMKASSPFEADTGAKPGQSRGHQVPA